MIRLTCTSCKTVMEMDDAFAGGACRCHQCGTIQTVPSHLKGGSKAPQSEVEAAARKLPQSKTLYTGKGAAPPPGSGTGLDELAQVVSSSGLSGSGLSGTRRKPVGVATAPGQKKQMMLVGAIAGAVVVALIALGAFFMLGGDGASGGGRSSTGGGSGGAVSGPAFVDLAIKGNTVIYLLDRGSATRDYFGALKSATYASIRSLGPNRKFQIVFWHADADSPAFPADTPTFATPDNALKAEESLSEVAAYGATEWEPALERALKHDPDAIVIATGKGWDLDEAFADSFLAKLDGKDVTVYTISLGSADDESPGLAKLAAETGGEFRSYSAGALRSASR
jgi:hypothetical protein